jgi:hypothetical protein
MQGLSPEDPETSEPLHTATLEGTPEESPRPGEIPLVTLPHVDISDIPEVFTPPPQIDQLLILLLSIAFTILLRIIAFVAVKDLLDDFIFLVTIFPLLNQSLGPSHGILGQ